MTKEIFNKRLLGFYIISLFLIILFFLWRSILIGSRQSGGFLAGLEIMIFYIIYISFLTVVEILSPILFNLEKVCKELDTNKNQLIKALLVGNIISIILTFIFWVPIALSLLLGAFIIVIIVKSLSIKLLTKNSFLKSLKIYFIIHIALFIIPLIFLILFTIINT